MSRLEHVLSSKGRVFQSIGAETVNDLAPYD